MPKVFRSLKTPNTPYFWNVLKRQYEAWNGVAQDSALGIARGSVDGMEVVNKFGRNPDVDAVEDIWDGGGLYVPPTAARVHNIASTSDQDSGTVLSSGTITTAGTYKLIDSTATFSSDGIVEHDIVLNDDTQDHSLVISVDSETQLTVHRMHHDTTNVVGANYRIVTTAGTGAVVAHIKRGLDADMNEQTEFVVLNGTSNVATTKSYLRINRMHIHGVGSSKTNVGNITATAVTDATVTAQITAGRGQTLMAFFTVPRGKNGYVTNIYATLNKTGGAGMLADFAIYERLWADSSNAGGDGELVSGYFSIQYGTPFSRTYNPYLYISEFADFWIRCESVSASNADFSAGFDMILVDK